MSGFEHFEALAASGTQPIFAFWHGRILPATLFWRNRGIVVMTSQNFDGEWIAGIIRRFGYATARGSSSRGGARALVQMRRELAAGKPVAFTLDGPRGPRGVLQPGAVWLAAATGHPILPFHIEATPNKVLKTWDATLVPAPFARVAVAISPPLVVSTNETTAAANAGAELIHRLATAQREALRLLN